jgi:hydrogenase nickel incorporation protein HypB
MCDTCGCTITAGNEEHAHAIHASSGADTIEVLESLLDQNNQQAAHNRHHFDAHGVLAVNLMSSPGAGKTTLLEATIRDLGKSLRVAVIEGDLETENDAERIRRCGVPAVQITTGTACHLDSHLIHDALHTISLDEVDILFIENVGNLVCPASFDLGQHLDVTLLSTTEGDDKPAKYPVMFRASDIVLLTKTDLLDALQGDFEPDKAENAVRALGNEAPVLRVSARRPQTLAPWLDWIRERKAMQSSPALSQAG